MHSKSHSQLSKASQALCYMFNKRLQLIALHFLAFFYTHRAQGRVPDPPGHPGWLRGQPCLSQTISTCPWHTLLGAKWRLSRAKNTQQSPGCYKAPSLSAFPTILRLLKAEGDTIRIHFRLSLEWTEHSPSCDKAPEEQKGSDSWTRQWISCNALLPCSSKPCLAPPTLCSCLRRQMRVEMLKLKGSMSPAVSQGWDLQPRGTTRSRGWNLAQEESQDRDHLLTIFIEVIQKLPKSEKIHYIQNHFPCKERSVQG